MTQQTEHIYFHAPYTKSSAPSVLYLMTAPYYIKTKVVNGNVAQKTTETEKMRARIEDRTLVWQSFCLDFFDTEEISS